MADSEQILWHGQLVRYRGGVSTKVGVRLTPRVLQIKNLAIESSQDESGDIGGQVSHIETFWLNEVVTCDRVAFTDAATEDADNSQRCCSRFMRNKHVPEPTIEPTELCLRFVIYATRSSDRRKAQRETLYLIESKLNDDTSQHSLTSLYSAIRPLTCSALHPNEQSQKPLLVFINPHSGKGAAVKLFDKRVRSILEDCQVKHQIFITKHAGHATEFVKDTPDIAEKFSGLCTLSGDGLLWEVLNGFVDSVEGQGGPRRIPLPLGIIPGGSGNGLAHSLNSFYYRGGKSSDPLVDNTLHVAKGRTAPMDLMRFTQENQRVLYGFLSFGWGLMSDIDIESERLRFLGEVRFTIWSLYRAANTKKYPGTLSYLPADKRDSPVRDLLSPLSSDWVSVSGPFITVYASIQPYLSKKVQFAPESQLDDSVIYLLYIREGVSSMKIVQFLVSLEEGTHIKLPYVDVVPVRAFRLTPHGTSSDIMTIDGERIESQTIQAQIMPRALDILLRS